MNNYSFRLFHLLTSFYDLYFIIQYFNMKFQTKSISLFSLNYSGLLDSPFEFFSQALQKEQAQISKRCQFYLKRRKGYDQKIFKWNVGKIDQKYQKQRYTPIYNPKSGIEKDSLVDEEEFRKCWEKCWKPVGFEYTNQQKMDTQEFDFLVYATLVAYAYDRKQEDYTKIPFKQLGVQKYANLMKKFYEKSFLNEKKKIARTIQMIQKRNVDIVFFQESNQNILLTFQQTKQFHIISDKSLESAILIRKKSFPNNFPTKPQVPIRNWNEDTIYCEISGIILICAHLSSKMQKNSTQVAQLHQDILALCHKHPQYHLIIGIDANTYLNLAIPNLNIFPNQSHIITTKKKRTWMQTQVKKANQLAQSCRDHIISSLKLLKCSVETINGGKGESLIPTQDHPYDHYAVVVEVKL